MRENKMMFIVFMLGTFTVGMAEYSHRFANTNS